MRRRGTHDWWDPPAKEEPKELSEQEIPTFDVGAGIFIPDAAKQSVSYLSVSGAVTIYAPANMANGATHTYVIHEGGRGRVAWHKDFVFPDGKDPDLSLGTDTVSVLKDGNKFYATHQSDFV